MLKPTLVYLYDEPPTDAVKIWPEVNDIHMLDLRREIVEYDRHGMPIMSVADLVVVCIPEGSDGALHILEGELPDNYVACVSVRKSPGTWPAWWVRLDALTRSRRVLATMHDRHDVCEVLALRNFNLALRHLDDCVDLVRGDGIEATPEAMRTEKALSKAIELLKATGFRAPRRR